MCGERESVCVNRSLSLTLCMADCFGHVANPNPLGNVFGPGYEQGKRLTSMHAALDAASQTKVCPCVPVRACACDAMANSIIS